MNSARHTPILILAAVLALPVTTQLFAQSASAPTHQADYHDLRATPEAYLPASVEEKRGQRIVNAIGALPDAFLIAMNAPASEAALGEFAAARARGGTQPAQIVDFVKAASAFHLAAADVLKPGSAKLTDSQADQFVAQAQGVKTLEDRIIDSGGMDISGLSYQETSKPNLLIYSIIDLANRGMLHLNSASADPARRAEVKNLIRQNADDRENGLLSRPIPLTDVQRNQAKQALAVSVAQDINGDLWKVREMNAFVVSGLDHPDPVAKEIFNTVPTR